jgi:hypothetical protein
LTEGTTSLSDNLFTLQEVVVGIVGSLLGFNFSQNLPDSPDAPAICAKILK